MQVEDIGQAPVSDPPRLQQRRGGAHTCTISHLTPQVLSLVLSRTHCRVIACKDKAPLADPADALL